MRNLQPWSLILTFLIGIFGCARQSASGFKPNSEPEGFAGIKWATAFSEVGSDMVESRSITNPAEPNVKIKIYYTKKADNLRIGEAEIGKIEYVFYRGKFAEAQIAATGPENFDRLKKFLFEKYGSQDRPSQGVYSWNGTVTQIALRYNEPTQTSSLTIASTRLINQELRELVDSE